MTKRERATAAAVVLAFLWLATWFTLGATIGVDFGDGQMHYGLSGGCAVMGLSLMPFLLSAFFVGGIAGIARWIEAGK